MYPATPAPTPRARPPLVRPRRGRVVAGVAAGIGAHLHVDPNVVRLAFVVLALAGGAGVFVYAVAWLLIPAEPPGVEPPVAAPAVPSHRAVSGWDGIGALALGAVVLGVLLLLRAAGVWFVDVVVWPAVIIAVGAGLIWSRFVPGGSTAATAANPALDRLPPAVAERIGRLPPSVVATVGALVGGGPAAVARVVGGVVLVVLGLGVVLAASGAFDAVRQGVLAVVVVGAGLGLIFGPWLWRLAADLAEERRARIREAERAELAAHLHDSVLQTLALIQRRADDPRTVLRLARRQERELRAWLYGPAPAGTGATWSAALATVAAEVEDTYGVSVEVVRVGDAPLDEDLHALVLAGREAMANAARHSGAAAVAVYAELEPDRATLFVRDRGCGFRRADVGPDRRGIVDSIEGRMERHGGTAAVRAEPGEGTEVELVLPRNGARP